MKYFDQQSKISVAIRKRPLNKKQLQKNQPDIVQVRNNQTVIVSQFKQKVDLTKYVQQNVFDFDYAFSQTTNNQQIYKQSVRPLIQSAFKGARVTCFAYGQTGSGKTYTMNGDNYGVQGLYFHAAKDIFKWKLEKKYEHLWIQVSFFQIYCGKLFDLLNNRNQLKLRQDQKSNVHIVDLSEFSLNSIQQFLQIVKYGSSFRVTSQNSSNLDSSRSHAILQITLKQGKKLIYGKISFIDLAGCQRGADHMDQNKQTRIDGAEINKSLLSLKQCIRALDQGKLHTPFRGSKLTMVLKDSFIGFCRTIMIGNISPGLMACQNTLNTLRYADRVKQLRRGNHQQQKAYCKQDQLAQELMLPRMNKNNIKIMIDKDDDEQDIKNKRIQAESMKIRYMNNKGESTKNQANPRCFSKQNINNIELSKTSIDKNVKADNNSKKKNIKNQNLSQEKFRKGSLNNKKQKISQKINHLTQSNNKPYGRPPKIPTNNMNSKNKIKTEFQYKSISIQKKKEIDNKIKGIQTNKIKNANNKYLNNKGQSDIIKTETIQRGLYIQKSEKNIQDIINISQQKQVWQQLVNGIKSWDYHTQQKREQNMQYIKMTHEFLTSNINVN